jgi:hypothetical protein
MILRRVSDWVRDLSALQSRTRYIVTWKKSSAPRSCWPLQTSAPKITRVGGSSASYQGSRHGEKGRIAMAFFFSQRGGFVCSGSHDSFAVFVSLFPFSFFFLEIIRNDKLTPPHLYQ